jgi:hypothetical protein
MRFIATLQTVRSRRAIFATHAVLLRSNLPLDVNEIALLRNARNDDDGRQSNGRAQTL